MPYPEPTTWQLVKEYAGVVWRLWRARRALQRAEAAVGVGEFQVGHPQVIETREEWERYKAWAAAQVCSGCDTPGCGPGCGRRASERQPGEGWWVTETCCWACHFKHVARGEELDRP